jgi:hypothetical protein
MSRLAPLTALLDEPKLLCGYIPNFGRRKDGTVKIIYRLWTIIVVSLIAPLALAGCSKEEPSIPTVAVTAADFSFSLPETIAPASN